MLLAASSAGGAIVVLLYIAFVVLIIAGYWMTFTKAGQPGWTSIIPILNLFVILKIVKRPLWWVLLMLIPCVNLIVWIIVADRSREGLRTRHRVRDRPDPLAVDLPLDPRLRELHLPARARSDLLAIVDTESESTPAKAGVDSRLGPLRGYQVPEYSQWNGAYGRLRTTQNATTTTAPTMIHPVDGVHVRSFGPPNAPVSQVKTPQRMNGNAITASTL